MPVRYETDGPVAVVTIDRPEVANAVDGPTARELAAAFRRFEADDDLAVAVLTGAGGRFCAGADLKAIQEAATATEPAPTRTRTTGEPDTTGEPGEPGSSEGPGGAGWAGEGDGRGGRPVPAGDRLPRVTAGGDGPLGPTRMLLDKPVIAAVEGHAVAGGLELAVWCDLRIAGADAIFGVYCRRWGVPLVDGGTIRLSRLIGHGRALDMILTGRGVRADEALQMGLATRVVPTGQARPAAVELAHQMARFPQAALRNDRRSSYEQWSLPLPDALANEYRLGMASLSSPEMRTGVARFRSADQRSDEFP